MNAGRLAGLLGLMAGAGALGRPEEVQAAAIPGIGKELVRLAKKVVADNGSRAAVPVGTVEQLAFDTAKKLDPRITTSNSYAGPHAVVVRSATGDMSMEDAAKQLENLLNSKTAFAIPNIPLRDPTKHRDSAGLFIDPLSKSLFAVPFSGRNDGGILFYTGFPPTGKNYAFVQNRVKDFYNTHPELGLSGETLRSSHIRSQELPPAVAQRPGFSAVGEPAQVEGILGEMPAKGKKNLPALAGASGATLSHYGAEPEPAHAFPGVQAYAGKPDLPLKAPWLDPVDMLVAPVGVPGAGAKAVAMAMAPAFSYGLERLGGLLGRLGAGE